VLIVFGVTRAIIDVLGYFFDSVHAGRLRVPYVHPETAGATRRIVTVIAWLLGLAVAYPFIPGSDSDAFKGLSVLLGLVLSLGSTGLMTQAMSGLVVVYSRALRRGDFVRINDVEGVVVEVASLATKIVNVRNEEITIPRHTSTSVRCRTSTSNMNCSCTSTTPPSRSRSCPRCTRASRTSSTSTACRSCRRTSLASQSRRWSCRRRTGSPRPRSASPALPRAGRGRISAMRSRMSASLKERPWTT
jgi:hypothetical protein